MARPSSRRAFADSPASGVVLLAGMVLVWEAVARLDPAAAFYVSPASRILLAFWQLTRSGEIPQAALSTLAALAAGFSIGTVAGGSMGVAIGRSRTLYDLLEPTLEFLRPAPAIAILPLAILLLGPDFTMRSAVIAWAAFWPVLSAACDGVRAIDPVLLETARSYGYRGFGIVRRIVLPAAVPYAMAGLRVALTLAFAVTVFLEMFTGDRGLGYLISHYRESIRLPETYAVMLAVAALGYAINAVVLAGEARLASRYQAAADEPR